MKKFLLAMLCAAAGAASAEADQVVVRGRLLWHILGIEVADQQV